jgi:hypothetical protein
VENPAFIKNLAMCFYKVFLFNRNFILIILKTSGDNKREFKSYRQKQKEAQGIRIHSHCVPSILFKQKPEIKTKDIRTKDIRTKNIRTKNIKKYKSTY